MMGEWRAYRLDYYGDASPEQFTAQEARLIVELTYPDRWEALQRLQSGLPVPVHAGVIIHRAMMVN
jgi:hypothetical protein